MITSINEFRNILEKKNKSKLSKAAKKFISDKIEFLIGKEGKPRKQAVAMAYSYAEREGLIKEDVQTDAAKFNIDVKPGEFDGKPINIWTMNIANDMKFGNWESAMRWLVDLWKSDEDLYYFFRGELSTSDELVIGDQIFAGIDVQDHMKLVSESIVNESGSTKAGDFEILTPITSVKNKEGEVFSVGDMVRIKNYVPEYVPIVKLEVGIAGHLMVWLDTYDLQQDVNELEHEPTA